MLRRLVKSEHDVAQKSSQTKLLLGKWVALGVELIVTKYVDRIWDKIRETGYLEIFKFSVSKGVLRNSQLKVMREFFGVASDEMSKLGTN